MASRLFWVGSVCMALTTGVLACSSGTVVGSSSGSERSADSGATDGGTTSAADGGGTIPDHTIDYATEVQPIWDKYCVGCHTDRAVTPRLPILNKTSPAILGDTVSKKCGPLVVPGKPEESFLVYKIRGGKDSSLTPPEKDCARVMPADYKHPNGSKADTPLLAIDPDAVALIEMWIKQGAK